MELERIVRRFKIKIHNRSDLIAVVGYHIGQQVAAFDCFDSRLAAERSAQIQASRQMNTEAWIESNY